MKSIGYFFALVFVVFCFVMIGRSNINDFFVPLIRQNAADNYPSTTGEVLQSDIYSFTNSNRIVKYRPNIEYKYQVNGQYFESHCIRYFDDYLYSESSNFVSQIIRPYPKYSAVRVSYNPKNPADALLSPGVIGDDVATFFKPLSFYYIGLFLGGVCFVKLYQIVFKPVAGGVKVIYEGRMVYAQLPWFSPVSIAMIAGILSLGCFSMFSNRRHVSLAAAVMELFSNLALVVMIYIWMRCKAGSGIYNLDIDKDAGTIVLPKKFGRKDRLSFKISDISAVTLVIELVPGKNMTRNFIPTLQFHHKDSKPVKIVKWNEMEGAEAFAVWLREQLGLPPMVT